MTREIKIVGALVIMTACFVPAVRAEQIPAPSEKRSDAVYSEERQQKAQAIVEKKNTAEPTMSSATEANKTKLLFYVTLKAAQFVEEGAKGYFYLPTSKRLLSVVVSPTTISINSGAAPEKDVSTQFWLDLADGKIHFTRTKFTAVGWQEGGQYGGPAGGQPVYKSEELENKTWEVGSRAFLNQLAKFKSALTQAIADAKQAGRTAQSKQLEKTLSALNKIYDAAKQVYKS